jgi:hypothetical protein
MGRAQVKLETSEFFDMLAQGMTHKAMATELGMSTPTLEKRIADLQSKTGLIMKYREIQNLQLTELQGRVLEAITPEKIAEASLSELVAAFRILKDKELVVTGKPTEIKGLVGYLVELEKREHVKDIAVAVTVTEDAEVIDSDEEDNSEYEEVLPNI